MTIIEIGAICGAVMAIVGVCAWVIKTVKKLTQPISDVRKATMFNLQYSITRACDEYAIKGEIGTEALRCIHDLHGQYEALGGNNFVCALVSEVDKLPVKRYREGG